MGLERRHLGKQRRFPNQFEHAACAVSFYIFLDYPYLPNPSSNFQVILRFYPLLARVNTKDQGYDGTRTNERIVFKIQPIFVRSNNRAKKAPEEGCTSIHAEVCKCYRRGNNLSHLRRASLAGGKHSGRCQGRCQCRHCNGAADGSDRGSSRVSASTPAGRSIIQLIN